MKREAIHMPRCRRGPRTFLTTVLFGLVAFLVYGVAFSPAATQLLSGHVVSEVSFTLIGATLAAYACRGVIINLLRLCGYG
jgi:hypothetical protein